ncbi:hypothetical protein EDB81DRAFT_884902 [Dactylonectria macrodidyma]|uniref:Uncharacterized protein n=1 Tax=Dactylonectria macrodidyma TaxID=307937 RepID=A0A9P9ERE4_9HYPO|nr:hypothetical protein EDB81DRAFT_884902 [Dactylonectria macrodidyma]
MSSKDQLRLSQALVKRHTVNLNYRELAIAGPQDVNGPITPLVTSLCDSPGTIKGVAPWSLTA